MAKAPQNDLTMISLESHHAADNTAAAWSCYWRTNLLLTLIAATVLLWIGDTDWPLFRTALSLAVLNTLAFPLYLAFRTLWKNNIVFSIVLSVILAGTPWVILLWGGLILFLGKTLFRVRRHFTAGLITCLLLLAISQGALKMNLVSVPERYRLNMFRSAAPAALPVRPPMQKHAAPTAPTATPNVQPTPTPQPTPAATPVPAPTATAFVDFQERNGLFSMQLPHGFTHRTELYRDGTKNIFDYGAQLSLVILASTMDKPWNADEAMNSKAESIRLGNAGSPLSRLTLESAERTAFASGTGYTLMLTDKYDPAMRMAALVRVDQQISFSATVTCTATNQHPLLHQILRGLQQNVTIRGKNTPSAPHLEPLETPHIPTTETARERIRIQGVMEKNGVRTVLIGGLFHQQGDRIAVQDGSETFVFTIKHIGKNIGSVELEPVLNP